MIEHCSCQAYIKTIWYKRLLKWRKEHYCDKRKPVDTDSNTEISPKYDYEDMISPPIIGFIKEETES